MASFNKSIVMGYLTTKPELRYTPNKTAVCDIGIAVNERIKRNNEFVEIVHFVDVTFWGKQAETLAKYLDKGSLIQVEGRLQQDRWIDNKTGAKRSKLKVICETFQMLGDKKVTSESQPRTVNVRGPVPQPAMIAAPTDNSTF